MPFGRAAQPRNVVLITPPYILSPFCKGAPYTCPPFVKEPPTLVPLLIKGELKGDRNPQTSCCDSSNLPAPFKKGATVCGIIKYISHLGGLINIRPPVLPLAREAQLRKVVPLLQRELSTILSPLQKGEQRAWRAKGGYI